MGATLLDVNLLIALFDPRHVNFEQAHAFFSEAQHQPWATTPLTIDGFVRITSGPSYPNVELTPNQSAAALRQLCQSRSHVFWADAVSLADDQRFHLQFLTGHKQVSDAHLLALAVSNNGKLATFDRKIPLHAVAGATQSHLLVL